MSYFFKSDDKDNSKETYRKAFVYKHFIDAGMEHNNFIDFHSAEKYLYGRVSYAYVPIEINRENCAMATLPRAPLQDGLSLQAPAFVVKAFEDLRAQFVVKSLEPAFDRNHPFLSNLHAAAAWIDPQNHYRQHITKMQDSIVNLSRQKNVRFQNFEQFLRIVLPLVKKVAKTMPYTYPGFLKSKYCNFRVSGLAIDLAADRDFNNDELKINLFRNSNNWDFFVNACRQFGFSVDKTAPWRIVADIGSSEMVKYAVSTPGCAFGSTNEILSFGYKPAHISYYETFADSFLTLYNKIKFEYAFPRICEDGTLRSVHIVPKEYTSANLKQGVLNRPKLLKLYMQIRLIEDEDRFGEGEKNRLIKECLAIARGSGVYEALGAFENFIGQTYEYSGSLTKRIRRVKMLEQMEEDDISSGKLDTKGGSSGGGY